ncbi:MAG: DNA alkylation repair protein [Atribacterota bacterium]
MRPIDPDHLMDFENIFGRLRNLADPEVIAGMARFGIATHQALGISLPALRKIAREIGKDHRLALQLWESGIHEARILAGLVEDANLVTEEQMEQWVSDFDSWDLCDQCCNNLFIRIPLSDQKAKEWTIRGEEFTKRAGFVLIACLAVHDKKASDNFFRDFFPLIIAGSSDQRNLVKKAVNWALRQIGKRNQELNRYAIETAMKILKNESSVTRWIGRDALRELQSPSVQKRLADH